MDSHPSGEGPSRSESRERRYDNHHKTKSKKESKKQGKGLLICQFKFIYNNLFSGTSWKQHDGASRPVFTNYSDVRPKGPTVRGEGIPFHNRRQNRSVKAECFLNLVYDDDRSSRSLKDRKGNRKGNQNNGGRRTAYTTENYMQANCQYAIDSSSLSMVARFRENPDFAPPWEIIREIRLNATSEPNCPICMSKPVARRITTCGHLFCLPCLLHYFTVKDEKQVPCPICFSKLDISCVKPASFRICSDFSVGDKVSFVLSRSPKGTTIVEPVDSDPSAARLSNVTFVSKREMIIHMEEEKQKLRNNLKENVDSIEENIFIEEAIKMLEREIEALEVCEEPQQPSPDLLGVSPPKPHNIVYYVDAFDDHEKVQEAAPAHPEPEPPRDEAAPVQEEPSKASAPAKAANDDSSYYYFYQSNDGQRIYLSSFNVRCLLRQFGHFSRCPQLVEGNIINIEYFNVTPEVRSQLKYLSHLPLNSHFQSVEIDLEPVLSDEIRQHFQSEFLRRKTERDERRCKEEAYNRRAEKIAERITEFASNLAPLPLDEPLVYDHAAFLADSPSLFSPGANAIPTPNDSPSGSTPGSAWGAGPSSSFARVIHLNLSFDFFVIAFSFF